MPAPPHPLLSPSQLGRLLHSARKAKGMSQADLAVRVGISQPRLSSLELNPATIRVDQLLAWCASLGLELTVQHKPDGDGAPATGTEW